MSRPPIDRAAPSPRGIDTDQGQTTYFGLRFADLVALAEALARDPGGVPIPGSSDTLAPGIVEIPAKDRGLARTLVEIPALFAHILGEHQSHYAAEAYLGTATQPGSLIRHGRRLAYIPDQGVAATGLAVFEVKEELTGTVPLHFALQSEPKGEIKSQTYETLEATYVEADWNAILPVTANSATQITFSGDIVTLPVSAPAGLDVGDIAVLQGNGKAAVCEVVASTTDTLRLRRLSQGPEATGVWPAYDTSDPYVVLARPDTELRMFGHAADPQSFPPTELVDPSVYSPPPAPFTVNIGGMDVLVLPVGDNVRYGYSVEGLSSGTYSPGESLILAEAIDAPESGAAVALVRPGGSTVFTVAEAREAAISFLRGERILIPQPDPVPDNFPTDQLVERSVSARATLLDLIAPDDTAADWTALPLDGVLYAGWTREIAIEAEEPNTDVFTATVALAADLTQMRPGRAVVVERPSDGFAASASVTRLAPLSSGWEVTLSFDPGAVASLFTMGDVQIRANAAPVSHGETKTEVLGASDGVTPHQAFELKTPGVTRIADATGSTPELSVRVDGVLWDLVEDFHDAAPEDRAYRTEADADQKLSVVFGGEGRGAVPPSGSRNVTAEYRTGLGRAGDAGAGRLTRIKKASPILDSVTNPMALAGGTDPAAPEDMRRQATRPILTFDRAVSLQDHADLALLFPGIARASARWLDRGAVELIAADADGNAPADPSTLRAFLDERRDTEVPLVLLDPQAVDVCITLRVERDRAWLADAVRLEVTEVLLSDDTDAPGLFTFAGRAFSAPQSLSGLYDRVLALAGITGAEASRFDIAPGTGVVDIIHATDRQWLRLLPGNLIVEVAEPGALIPDLEGGTP
jgi:hypothetical protein